jgi:MscS family membrane protein
MPLEIVSIENLASALEHYPWLEPLLQIELFENTLAHYVLVVTIVLAVYLVSKLITWFIEKHARRYAKRTENTLDDMVLSSIHRSITFMLVLAAFYFGVKSLSLPESVDLFTMRAVFILFTLKVAQELQHFAYFCVKAYLAPLARKQKGLTKTFLPPITRIIKIVIWSLAILLIVSNMGYDVSSLIAGLGIGGLALALAAEKTLSNVFGSFTLLADQPFKVGDWVSVENYEGTVIDVGMRSTRIETIDLSVVSIPNSTMASAVIENVSTRSMMNVSQVLNFPYETSLTQIRDLIKALERMLRRDPDVEKSSLRVRFTEFGDSALKIEVFYYITDTSSYDRMLEIRERINLKIKDTVEKIGVDLIYPTRSLRIHDAKTIFKTTQSRRTK